MDACYSNQQEPEQPIAKVAVAVTICYHLLIVEKLHRNVSHLFINFIPQNIQEI